MNDPAAGRSDSIRFGPSAYGVERAEVHLSARGFDPHRHDTYGIGVTTAGVQVFRYRGEQRVCLPGQLHILHPDWISHPIEKSRRVVVWTRDDRVKILDVALLLGVDHDPPVPAGSIAPNPNGGE